MLPESRTHVVIVEDDPAMNLALTRLLKAAGFSTVAFESAEDLFDHPAAIANADCLILDVHLTGRSGVELHKELGECGVHPPTIFITADEDYLLPPARDNAPTMLTKPFSRDRLLAAIREALLRLKEETEGI